MQRIYTVSQFSDPLAEKTQRFGNFTRIRLKGLRDSLLRKDAQNANKSHLVVSEGKN